MDTTKNLVMRYLNDAWAAEQAHRKMLANALERIDESQVLSLLRDEFLNAQKQEDWLAACLRGRGEEPSDHKSIFGRTMELLASHRHEEDEFDAATVALEKEFGAASLKVGLYRTLEAYASLGDMADVALVAHTHLTHEREALARAWSLMPQVAAETMHQTHDTQAQETATAEGMPPAPESAGPSPWTARMDNLPIDSGPLAFTPPVPLDTTNGRRAEPRMPGAVEGECVRDVMTRAVGTVSPETTVRDAAAMMRDLDVGPLPVCDGQRVVGMITDRDLALRVVAMGRDPHTTPVREVMTSEIVCATETDALSAATQLMKEMQVRRLPVVDDEQHLRGILSLGDIALRQGSDGVSADVLRRVSEPGPAAHVGVLQ